MGKKTNKEIRESHLKPTQKRRNEKQKKREETAMAFAFREAMNGKKS